MTSVFHPSRYGNVVRSYRIKDLSISPMCPTCGCDKASWIFIDLTVLSVEYRCKDCCPLEDDYVG